MAHETKWSFCLGINFVLDVSPVNSKGVMESLISEICNLYVLQYREHFYSFNVDSFILFVYVYVLIKKCKAKRSLVSCISDIIRVF